MAGYSYSMTGKIFNRENYGRIVRNLTHFPGHCSGGKVLTKNDMMGFSDFFEIFEKTATIQTESAAVKIMS